MFSCLCGFSIGFLLCRKEMELERGELAAEQATQIVDRNGPSQHQRGDQWGMLKVKSPAALQPDGKGCYGSELLNWSWRRS